MSKLGHIYNHKKDKPTGLEEKFEVKHYTVESTALPTSFDLRTNNPLVPSILDQGQLGSCGPNELSNALKFCLAKHSQNPDVWQPSRLYIYYFTRLVEGEPSDQDTGISIGGAFQALLKYGSCSEIHWPYVISKYTVEPLQCCITAGETHCKSLKYLSVNQDLVSIKQALVSGCNVVIGIQVYESFESAEVASTGTVPMPNTSTEQLLGGHCLSIWSYDDTTLTFGVMNSWGTTWGQQGYCKIPYQYILDPNLSSDFWIITAFGP